MPFTGGPSVRLTPTNKIEIRWIADFGGNGRVDIFDNANGVLPPVDVKGTPSYANQHRVEFTFAGIMQPDTTYFFKVTHTDPTGVRADLTNDPAPYPPFFTGAQVIGEVFADVDVDSAVISWTANVIGLGHLDYGAASPDEFAANDDLNITDHGISLSGLSPATTYQFRVSNRHAIDGDSLVESVGAFTTRASTLSGIRLTRPSARPRMIYPEDVATLSVVVRKQAAPVSNVPVHFTVNGAAGGDALSDASGKATIWMQGVTPGLLRVEASSPDAGNRLMIPVVVRR